MSILLIIMYMININYVQYFTFKPIENIKCCHRNDKIHLASQGFVDDYAAILFLKMCVAQMNQCSGGVRLQSFLINI